VSLSNAQKSLLKRAQREAGIDDGEYRDAIETISRQPGCRSSTDARLTDENVDRLMEWFEAIFWHGVDAGALKVSPNPKAAFRARGYWAGKNRAGATSRDRFADARLAGEIAALERRMAALGFGSGYCAGIRRRSGPGWAYHAALARTLASKERVSRQEVADQPAPDGNPF
jgi:hypothetical protein